MHVLLTGAAGFIGSHTAEALVARGHRVTGLDSFDEFLYPAAPKRRNAAHLAKLPSDAFTLVSGDLLDVDLAAVCAGVDVVCHLAALAGVRPSLAAPTRYMRTNVEGTARLLEAMRSADCRRWVFASSSSVYGARADAREQLPFSEDDPCLTPASPYAASKRMGELLCSTFRDLYGIGVSAMRFFTVYGPRQRHDMAIHKFVSAIAEGREIVAFGDGTSRRDYTFIDDIVAGTVAAVERATEGQFQIYNLGGAHTVSLRELIATIESVVGRPANVVWQADQPGDVPFTSANVARAGRDLGYRPTTPLAEGLRRYWLWRQSEGAL